MNVSLETSKQLPAISILLPFRNAESTFNECLDSILGQTMENFELIAVNDNSSDKSVEILKQYVRDDHRVRIFNNPHSGLVTALNHGLKQASAKLVARMDADDRMYPQRLQLQYDFMQQNPDITALGSFARLFPEEIIQAGCHSYSDMLQPMERATSFQNYCTTWATIVDSTI